MPPFALLSAAPTDLTLLILSFLSPATLTTCAATSSSLKPLCLHDQLWQQLLHKHTAKQPPAHLALPISTSGAPPSCYLQYVAHSLDALRTFVTLPELLQLRWRFVFHHSIPFSLLTSLTPTFNDTHVHAPPFGSYPYALYDRERVSERAEGERQRQGEEEEEEEEGAAPFLDLDGLPFIPAAAAAQPSPSSPSPSPPTPSAYELKGFLTPALRAECERLWSLHDESLHASASQSQLLSERSPLFARCVVPFRVLHLLDVMMLRSVCFQHLPLFVSERAEGGQWRLNNQLGAFESLIDEEPQAAGREAGGGEQAREGLQGRAEGQRGQEGGAADRGEAEQLQQQRVAGDLFELNDWLGDLDDEDW